MWQAAESFALGTVAWGWVRPASVPRRIDVLLFAAAAGAILHCYSDHCGQRRSVFRSSYLSTFDFILVRWEAKGAAGCSAVPCRALPTAVLRAPPPTTLLHHCRVLQGNTGFREASIRHCPSNADLLWRARSFSHLVAPGGRVGDLGEAEVEADADAGGSGDEAGGVGGGNGGNSGSKIGSGASSHNPAAAATGAANE